MKAINAFNNIYKVTLFTCLFLLIFVGIMSFTSLRFPLFFILFTLILCACQRPLRSFKHSRKPAPPDYSLSRYWASLPTKKDSADCELPKYGIIDQQKTARADVFFVHPTNYESGTQWNVNLDDSVANYQTDNLACKLEASVFNGSCKVYVPRYRAAILFAYFASKKNRTGAFNLAYEDVKNAFLHYMKHYNKGRPIVIAAHSQGTDFAVRLVKEFFDKDTSLHKQLVCAYLIGRPIYDTTFHYIRPCDSATQIGGYVVWNSVSYHTNTFYSQPVGTIIGVNPLSWKRDTAYVPATFNKGSLPFSFDRIDTAIVDAKLAPSGFLWVNKPNRSTDEYPAINTFYYHKDDMNFYYMNIRENVKQRLDQFIKEKK